MARSIRSATLETRSARLRLPVARKPVFIKLGPQFGLGYRRNRTAGTWVMRVADGKGGNSTSAIGTADDFEEADGSRVLDFWQAQNRARARAQGDQQAAAVTVGGALDRYEADLKRRSADPWNVRRVRHHMTDALSRKPVAALTGADLRRWRDGLDLAPATINRTSRALKAALNLVADQDAGIANRRAWGAGLAALPDAEEARNVILTDDEIRQLLVHAYERSQEFGLLVETAAVTGARASQLARLEVQDLQDGPTPRLLIPASRKGRGQRAVLRRPVPISSALARKLAATGRGRLLYKPSGAPWAHADHGKLFKRVARRCGLEATMYALRHSSIVRQLLAGVPVRVVAVNHDTSVIMIERNYSRHIGDHADALVRSALLDTHAERASGS